MNIPFAAAALLLAVAFFAHLFVGTRETLSQKPDEENTTQQGMRNWMQAVCAFQLVSIDLLLLAAAACLLAFTRIFDGMEAAAARFFAVYLGLWCTVWLIQLKMAGARGEDDFLLSAEALNSLRQVLPEAHLMNVPFAAHEVIKEQPDILWAAMKVFYKL